MGGTILGGTIMGGTILCGTIMETSLKQDSGLDLIWFDSLKTQKMSAVFYYLACENGPELLNLAIFGQEILSNLLLLEFLQN